MLESRALVERLFVSVTPATQASDVLVKIRFASHKVALKCRLEWARRQILCEERHVHLGRLWQLAIVCRERRAVDVLLQRVIQ